jgi:hypothetical protein
MRLQKEERRFDLFPLGFFSVTAVLSLEPGFSLL